MRFFSSAPHRVVIDTDPGIDDAMAIALAARSPEIDLQALTTVAGNVPLHQTTANAAALLAALGREDVPVAPGAAQGLIRAKPAHAAIHGPNGLGGVELPSPRPRPSRRRAVEELAAALRESAPGEVTIVAIGPLTNIALLLALHPELTDRIGRIVIMGGSTGAGNVTPSAEYNTWADPEAAERVFASGVDLWLAQLQATRQATLDAATHRALRGGTSLARQLETMLGGYDEGAGVNPALHDVVAVAAVVQPSLVRTRPAHVHVVTDLGERRGATVVDFDLTRGDRAPVQVVLEVDVPALRDLLVERVAGQA